MFFRRKTRGGEETQQDLCVERETRRKNSTHGEQPKEETPQQSTVENGKSVVLCLRLLCTRFCTHDGNAEKTSPTHAVGPKGDDEDLRVTNASGARTRKPLTSCDQRDAAKKGMLARASMVPTKGNWVGQGTGRRPLWMPCHHDQVGHAGALASSSFFFRPPQMLSLCALPPR